MTATQITIKTAYGRLVIPKADLDRVVYEDGKAPAEPGGVKLDAPPAPAPPRPPTPRIGPPVRLVASQRPLVTLEIRGRSFWYAFQGSSADPRIRLRLFLAGKQIAELVDAKPDTVDGTTLYNSFTFSPSESQVTTTAEGYRCAVEEAVDGKVVLRIELPDRPILDKPGDARELQMLYQVNEGTQDLPRWVDAVSRAFPIQVRNGKHTQIVLQQDASGLDFGGLMRKKMKNVESFNVSVLSLDLRDRAAEPSGSTR